MHYVGHSRTVGYKLKLYRIQQTLTESYIARMTKYGGRRDVTVGRLASSHNDGRFYYLC